MTNTLPPKTKVAAGKIINRIPRLLQQRNLTATDLLYGARLAPGTAYALANPIKTPKSINYAVLARVCDYLGVGLQDVLEYVPAKNEIPATRVKEPA